MEHYPTTLVIFGITLLLLLMATRELKVQPLRLKKLYIGPIIVAYLAWDNLSQVHTISSTAIGLLVLNASLGIILGFVRARSLHIYKQNGQLYQSSTIQTFYAWLVTLLIHASLFLLSSQVHTPEMIETTCLLLFGGATVLAQLIDITNRGTSLIQFSKQAIEQRLNHK